MKKKNGMTIVEILMALVLISMVVTFLFNLILDLKNEDSLSVGSAKDSVNRATIIRLIQNDFINYKLVNISKCSIGNLCIEFKFDAGGTEVTKGLIFYKKYVVYDNEKWTLNSGSYDIDNYTYKLTCYKNVGNNCDPNGYRMFELSVPVTTAKDTKRKLNIEVSYMTNSTLATLPDSVSNKMQ